MTMMQLLLTMTIAPLNSLTMTIMWRIFLRGAVLKSHISVERSDIIYLGSKLTQMHFCYPFFVAQISCPLVHKWDCMWPHRHTPGDWGEEKKNTMNLLWFVFLSKAILVTAGSSSHFITFNFSHPAFFLQVRFVCSEPTVLISSIKEISSCKYVVTVQSPMLCKNP